MRDVGKLLKQWLASYAASPFTTGAARYAVEHLSDTELLTSAERSVLGNELDSLVHIGVLKRIYQEGARRSQTYEILQRPHRQLGAAADESAKYTYKDKKRGLVRVLILVLSAITNRGANGAVGISLASVLGDSQGLLEKEPLTKECVHFPLLNARQWGLLSYDGTNIKWTRATEFILKAGHLEALVDRITTQADGDRRKTRHT